MIIDSLLDTDMYKFTMGQLIFNKYKDVQVKYKFIDRKKLGLGNIIPVEQLEDELSYVRELLFIEKNEIAFLRSLKIFNEDYLKFLEKLTLPEFRLDVCNNGEFILEFDGKWSEAIYWETIALSIINQLYYENILKTKPKLTLDGIFSTGVLNLIDKLNKLPEDVKICDFGTRRRFSKKWQWYVLEHMKEYKQLIGTSNVLAAMEFGLVPMGTFAHEMYMGMSGIMRNDLISSHNKVLTDWWDIYGVGLSIALTDTYGSKFFFQDFTPEQAKKWKGVRHDSEDPMKFGYKVLSFYEQLGINPLEKTLVFSDELNIDKIIALNNEFKNKIKLIFGWGTNLTNDLGLGNLSIVIKLMESNGYGTVKLSDSSGKEMGLPEDIEFFKHSFGWETYEKFL